MEVIFERKYPWAMLPVQEEIGWLLPCPADLIVHPVLEFEVAARAPGLPELKQATGLDDVWLRGEDTALLQRRATWPHRMDFEFRSQRHTLVFPLGDGWWELRLGLRYRFSAGMYALLLPVSGLSGVEVAPGILSHAEVERINNDIGQSIAIRPLRETRLSRGQSLARLLIVGPDTLRIHSLNREESDR